MEAAQTRSTPHPLVITAAVAVIIFSAAGTAAVMGWLPKTGAHTAPGEIMGQANAVGGAAPTVTQQSAASVQAAPVKPAAAVRAVPRKDAVASAESRPVIRETSKPVVVEHRPVAEMPQPVPVLAPPVVSPAPIAMASCRDCGVIESVNEIEKAGEGSGLGAVAGGVVGAIAGKQVGGGRGRNVMSVVGAVGGAIAGHQIEKNARKVKSYDITIRFEDGSSRTLSQATAPVWRAGDRVRLVNGDIQPAA